MPPQLHPAGTGEKLQRGIDAMAVKLEIVKGNIVAQPGIDAIVNAANAWLRPGGGVARASHRAAGPGLAEECRPLAPIKPGEAVLTGGHRLPNPYVIHVLGPVYGRDKPEDRLLAACYRNALRLAEEHRLSSLAFPAISTGAFAYPPREAAEVALKTMAEIVPGLEQVKLIRVVLFCEGDFKIYKELSAVYWPFDKNV